MSGGSTEYGLQVRDILSQVLNARGDVAQAADPTGVDASLAETIRTGGRVPETDAMTRIQQMLQQLADTHGDVAMTPDEEATHGRLTGTLDAHGYVAPDMETQGLLDRLHALMGTGGDFDSARVQGDLETAREQENRAFQSMMGDARGELASRGLISQPGVGQGAEVGAVGRISDRIAPQYAAAVRDIINAERGRASDRSMAALGELGSTTRARSGEAAGRESSALSALSALTEGRSGRAATREAGALSGLGSLATGEEERALTRSTNATATAATRQTAREAQANSQIQNALSLATGLAQNETASILAAAGSGTQRQQVLGNIALQTLDQNRQWNQFLATYGLDRARLQNEIESGNLAALMPILNMFLQIMGLVGSGYTPPD